MQKHRLSQSGSVLLDLLRFSAALVVLLSHASQFRFARVLPDFGNSAHLAVCLFFVLSGFIIRFVTTTRLDTVKDYFIDRASRIYSVLVPALLLTFTLEGFARWIHPKVYLSAEGLLNWSQLPIQFVATVTFLAQCWGHSISPASNTPFWSLSYECLYYVAYALFHYRVRGRYLLAPLVMLLAGPDITLLFPVWLFGCLVFDLYVRLSRSRYGFSISSALLFFTASVFVAARHIILRLISLTSHEHRLIFERSLLARTHLASYLPPSVDWFPQASISFIFFGVMTGVFVMWGLVGLDRFAPNFFGRPAPLVRTIADSTFALYLLHLPMLIFVRTLLAQPFRSAPALGTAILAIIVVCIAIGELCDKWKDHLRTLLRTRFLGRSASITTPA